MKVNEDFYIENQETWYDYVYFEPPYNPDDWYDEEQDNEWESDD